MMAGPGGRFLVVDGVLRPAAPPPIAAFLESISGECRPSAVLFFFFPSHSLIGAGAYTTTRTHGEASVVLFWERHLRRLADSARILAEASGSSASRFLAPPLPSIQALVNDSLRAGLRRATKDRKGGEELAITAIVRGWDGEEEALRRIEVSVHLGLYVPPVFGEGARLALAGRGRDIAEAKSTEWVR